MSSSSSSSSSKVIVYVVAVAGGRNAGVHAIEYNPLKALALYLKKGKRKFSLHQKYFQIRVEKYEFRDSTEAANAMSIANFIRESCMDFDHLQHCDFHVVLKQNVLNFDLVSDSESEKDSDSDEEEEEEEEVTE